ncbi:TetR family transcriptional regulator C-terminal domain-containing protein [uncultured Amnibacterium sp.]|uniref:TetR family transcriptional regulator C-terminal domain-containing protein n=1 Tax=uncultured Amnibacterium sp. TaxID=1631851 RepID=UPI0035CAC615
MLGRRRENVVSHDAVLAAATEIIQAEGPIAVTLDRLARALDVRAQQLEVDVPAVVAEAYRALSVAELGAVRRAVLANPSPAEQMRALLNWLATPPEDSDGIRLEAWALARHNPALRQAVKDGETAWHGLVASVVRRGARSNDFLQADADEIAAHLISLVDGINAYQTIGYRSDFDRMVLLTRVVQAELGLAWGPDLAEALA